MRRLFLSAVIFTQAGCAFLPFRKPVLRYSMETNFCGRGWLYEDATIFYDSGQSTVNVGSNKPNRTWDFSGFHPKHVVQMAATDTPFNYPPKWPHRDFFVIGQHYQAMYEEVYRVSRKMLFRRAFTTEGIQIIEPYLPLHFSYKNKYNSGWEESVSMSGKDTTACERTKFTIEGWAYGKLITPVRTYPNALLVKRNVESIFGSPHQIRSGCSGASRSSEVNYLWYEPGNGQFLFRVDSVRSSVDGDIYWNRLNVRIGYFSERLDTTGLMVHKFSPR